MNRHRNKLYIFLFIVCLAGYAWLFWNINHEHSTHNFIGCPFKQLIDIPCPSCGSTRAIISITNGNFLDALFSNPFGYVIGIIMIILPLWIMYDYFTKSSSLYQFYQKTEKTLKKPHYFLPLILLTILNWLWNISKNI